MTCAACAIASTDPRTGHFEASCMGCDARALAGGPDYWESAKAGKITPGYRRALAAAFGDGWQAGHHTVKRWAEQMAAAKK